MDSKKVMVETTQDELHQIMSELYNFGHFEMIATDGTRVVLVDTDHE